jgi:D-serine deaminase-like pyridoxal phosphate-dependent protein
MDIDASLRIGPLHLGVRRSPVHTAGEAYALAAEIAKRPELSLTGLMFYDAQIAGLPDTSAAVRAIKSLSARELIDRRDEVILAVRDVAELKLINGGGTGSLHIVSRDHLLTELSAGSGLYGPALFDHYRDFTPMPAAFFVSPVVRKPSPRHAVVYSSGYIASGPPGWSRQPLPWMPPKLRLLQTEGAGEVQTPLRGAAVSELQVVDQVWFRHAKAGELCERFDRLHLVQGDQIVDDVPTYRGEGRTFG